MWLRRLLPLSFLLATTSTAFAAPRTCAFDDDARTSAWDRARAPELSRFCDLLARAEACLRDDPKRAAETADLADKELPGFAEPLVVRARALAAMDSSSAAVELFVRAREIDEAALDDAAVLASFARALAASGDDTKAREAFRALLPKLSALESRAERVTLSLEAALAVLREGPDHAAESSSMLRSALADAEAPQRSLLRIALALSEDRRGARADATTIADDARTSGAEAWFEKPATLRSIGTASDRAAMRAELFERTKRDDAVSNWDIVARTGGPWAAHAKARAAELRRSPAKPPRGKDRPR